MREREGERASEREREREGEKMSEFTHIITQHNKSKFREATCLMLQRTNLTSGMLVRHDSYIRDMTHSET